MKLTLLLLLTLAPPLSAQWVWLDTIQTKSHEMPFPYIDFAFLVDEFPCKASEEGEMGILGWGLINTINTNTCGNNAGTLTGMQTIGPLSGNTPSGIALSRNGGGTHGFVVNAASSLWEMAARVKIYDLDEVIYKIGLADETAMESNDHAVAAGDFIGAIFKDEDSDTSGECGGTTGDSANWQVYTSKNGTSAGLQDSTLTASTSTWVWFLARHTESGVVVCVDHTNGSPTWPAAQCHEETSSANIPSNGIGPMITVSSCDGSSVSGNANRMDLDYFHLIVGRY